MLASRPLAHTCIPFRRNEVVSLEIVFFLILSHTVKKKARMIPKLEEKRDLAVD